MPELPEVETIRLGLAKATVSRRIEDCEVLLARSIAYPPSPSLFQTVVRHQEIVGWQRRGKYLIAQLSGGHLVIHLRMTGQLRWLDRLQPVARHTRVRLFCDQNQELRFDDQRTFGKWWWVPPDRTLPEIVTGLQDMGVEPLEAAFTLDYLAEKLQGRKRPIKSALLDQTIVAGIGNIYADEALFLSRIHPQRSTHTLTSAEIVQLHKAIGKVLQDGLRYGGTTFSSYLDASGEKGNYLTMAWVFRRTKEPCRVCNTAIEKVKIVGRSSHFCPNCQM